MPTPHRPQERLISTEKPRIDQTNPMTYQTKTNRTLSHSRDNEAQIDLHLHLKNGEQARCSAEIEDPVIAVV